MSWEKSNKDGSFSVTNEYKICLYVIIYIYIDHNQAATMLRYISRQLCNDIYKQQSADATRSWGW